MTGGIGEVSAAVRRAFSQFLTLPLVVVVACVALNIAVFYADDAWSNGTAPHGLAWLGRLLGDNQALNGLLTTVASSIITVTSITFSLLLLAIQQGSSALTAQVIDQFLMRRVNQFYFGFFVGLCVFVLLTLVTNSNVHRPIFAATFSLIGTTAALCMIVVMIYNTIEQMRPDRIVRAIHGHVLRAREKEKSQLARTRRDIRASWPVATVIRSQACGHLVDIDLGDLDRALFDISSENAEVEVLPAIGQTLAVGDPLYCLRLAPTVLLSDDDRTAFETAAIAAARLDEGRDLRRDPSLGLFQLVAIAWTSTSTAKSNPTPGLAVIHTLRDILARWDGDAECPENPASRIVVADTTPDKAVEALELIVVVASESIQAQTVAAALRSIAILLGYVQPRLAVKLADVVERALSTLGEHVLTVDLEAALADVGDALRGRDFVSTADAVATAARSLRQSVGHLNSRSTRVPGRG